MYPRHLVCCGLVAKTVWVTCSKSEPNTFADTHYKSSRLPQVIYVIITHRLMTGKVTTTANNYVDPSRSGIYISCVTPHAITSSPKSQHGRHALQSDLSQTALLSLLIRCMGHHNRSFELPGPYFHPHLIISMLLSKAVFEHKVTNLVNTQIITLLGLLYTNTKYLTHSELN